MITEINEEHMAKLVAKTIEWASSQAAQSRVTKVSSDGRSVFLTCAITGREFCLYVRATGGNEDD